MLPNRIRPTSAVIAIALILSACGCCCLHKHHVNDQVPNEATKVTQPPYTIGPPDILLINAGTLVPMPPYKVSALDILSIKATFPPAKVEVEPIAGLFVVNPEGKVDLGFAHGVVSVAGQTLEEARESVRKHLLARNKQVLTVSVDLAQSNQALQQIRGEHLVRADGTVGLGIYGSVFVDGMTIEVAKAVIEKHLSQFLVAPRISLDIAGYNSKVYYVITDLAGFGQRVIRLPITGKETVLDAVSQVFGLAPVSSKCMWVARPSLHPNEPEFTMKVDWVGISQYGQAQTNYELTAGDRLYIMGNPLITADTFLARVLSPIERLFGITLLGASTYTSVAFANQGGGAGVIIR